MSDTSTIDMTEDTTRVPLRDRAPRETQTEDPNNDKPPAVLVTEEELPSQNDDERHHGGHAGQREQKGVPLTPRLLDDEVAHRYAAIAASMNFRPAGVSATSTKRRSVGCSFRRA